MERRILEAVARADLIVCEALRVLAAIAAFAVVLLIVLLLIHCLARGDPCYIPYDVTSEGPDGDYTAAWYEWKEEEHGSDMG